MPLRPRATGVALPFLLFLLASTAAADPIAVSRANPHYFSRGGTPLVLVTSDHHYGAIIDRDFDFIRYLDTLAAAGMNLTRIYPGAMFEVPDKFAAGNPLGPLPGRHVLPWARSTTAGAHATLAPAGQPAMKFDLDRWDPEYFARLEAFVAAADARGIIVEVAFFNGMYADSWPLMPFYHRNNLQGVGTYEPGDCGLFTTNDPRNQDVMRYQAAYVARIATALNRFDNVIYDIADEPLLQGRPDGSIATLPEAAVVPWLMAMKEAFLRAEASLPKKHVLGQTVQSQSPDLSAEAWCDWLPTEYVRAAGAALTRNYAARKPLVNVESDYYGHGLVKPYSVDDVRLEGWWFMLGGGAGTINLNGEYHRGQESGGADTRDRILPQRKVLKTFMERLDLRSIARFDGVTGLPPGAMASALADPGRVYAVYLFHAAHDGQWGAHFASRPGTYRDTLTLSGVSAGRYRAEWIDPATGAVTSTATLEATGGDLALETPSYRLDVALRLERQHRLLITSIRTGDTEIVSVDPVSGDTVNLTRSPASEDRYPMWSPDGTKVAFTSDRDGKDTYNLYVMAADGTGQRRLTSVASKGTCYFPTWSGPSIYFGFDPGDGTDAVIARVSEDGTGFTVIGPGRDPAISPDGRTIAFTARAGTGYVVFTMDADGTDVRQLTTHENEIGAVTPTWSPDGAWIAYSDQVGEALELFVVSRHGGPSRQLTRLGQIASSPSWSPDMRAITFRVTDDAYWRRPDAKTYAYREKRPDKRPVWIIDADGSDPHVLEPLRLYCALDGSRAAWSPKP